MFSKESNQKGRKLLCIGRFAALAAAALFLAAAKPAYAASSESARPELYAEAALFDLGYVPAKIVFGTAGAITSGLAYVFTLGNRRASNAVWDSSVMGDYIITPTMLERGEHPRFVGP